MSKKKSSPSRQRTIDMSIMSKPTLKVGNKFFPIGKNVSLNVTGKVIRVSSEKWDKGSTVEVGKITPTKGK